MDSQLSSATLSSSSSTQPASDLPSSGLGEDSDISHETDCRDSPGPASGSHSEARCWSDVGHQKLHTFNELCLVQRLRDLLRAVADGRLGPADLFLLVARKESAPARMHDAHHTKGLELCCILETVYQLLSLGQVAYQRDVYYRYRNVLRSVQNVRALCGTVAAFLGIPPAQLHIIPCPKGVLFGRIVLELDDGSVVDCAGRNGHVVPPAESVHRVAIHRDVRTLLLVEKQTAFFALLQAGFGERFPSVLLATGKGYPDVNTRKFLATFLGSLDIAVLVDHDPDGAHIFQVYAEGGLDGSRIRLPNARWAGLHCSTARVGQWGRDVGQAVEFTAHDRSLALRLVQHWARNPALRRRMARMAYCGKQTELEAVTQFRAMALAYIASLVADRDQADRG